MRLALLGLLVASPALGQIRLLNEGADAGVILNIDCVGAGINCTRSGSIGTLTVGGGGGGSGLPADPSACAANTFVTDIDIDGNLTCTAVTAGMVTNTPAGNIAAVTVQAALNELDTEKVDVSGESMTGNLTAPEVYWGVGATRSADVTGIGAGADDILVSGWYRDNALNAILMHTQHPSNAGYAFQLKNDYASSGFFQIRTKTAGVWSSWAQVWNADSDGPASGLAAQTAATATALASNPSDCGSNQFANAIAASGNLTCATPALGTDTSGDYVATITGGAGIASTGATSGEGIAHSLSTASDEADFLKSGALTCGAATQGKAQVHTTPLQYCDNAATPTLRYSAYGDSSGNATGLVCSGCVALTSEVVGVLPTANGGTSLSAATDDNVMVGNGTDWQSKALTDCDDGTDGKHLNYDTATNAFSCGTTGLASYTRVTADVSNSTTSFADVTGLTQTVTNGSTWTWLCHVTYTTAVTTTAMQLSMNGPTASALDYEVNIVITQAAAATSGAFIDAVQTAYDTVTNPVTGGSTNGQRLGAYITGSAVFTADGTLAVRSRSEVGASAAVVKRGSWCQFARIGS